VCVLLTKKYQTFGGNIPSKNVKLKLTHEAEEEVLNKIITRSIHVRCEA
jgi:hypothetical protein